MHIARYVLLLCVVRCHDVHTRQLCYWTQHVCPTLSSWIWEYWTWKVPERSLNLKLTKVWEPL